MKKELVELVHKLDYIIIGAGVTTILVFIFDLIIDLYVKPEPTIKTFFTLLFQTLYLVLVLISSFCLGYEWGIKKAV